MSPGSHIVVHLFIEAMPGSHLGRSPEELTALLAPAIERWGGGAPLSGGAGQPLHLQLASPVAALRTVQAISLGLESVPGGRTGLRMALGAGPESAGDLWAHDELSERTEILLPLAHGGQTLVTAETAALLGPHLPEGMELLPVGTHRLPDLRLTQELCQLRAPGDAIQTTLHSLDVVPNNLPVQLTSFVGRRDVLQHVQGLLRANRLVTLTGSGGSGKTRLALQAGATMLGEFPDGVWLVDLSPLVDPNLVVGATLSALRLQEEPGRPAQESLAKGIAGKRLLIILDNCEHLISSSARLVNQLLALCPLLTVVATSREPLGVAGEVLWPVPSFAAPDVHQPLALESLAQFEAIRLFVQRARAVNPAFQVTAQNAGALATVCRRLDGIPLALELAAARTRILSVEQILARLDDRLQLLSSGNRTSLPRHQTLRATLDWSHDLLSPAEQSLWRRLAIFSGLFSLAAAESVCGGEEDVLDLLGQLVEKSLVVTEEHHGEKWFRLLETMRQYGRSRWTDEEEEALSQAHADWYLALLDSASPADMAQPQWLDRLELEHDNARQALQWAMENDQMEQAYRMACGLRSLWYQRYYLNEAWSRLSLLADRNDPRVSAVARAGVLSGAGAIAFELGEGAKAEEYFSASLPIFRAEGDQTREAATLHNLGLVAFYRGDYNLAISSLTEAIRLNRLLGHGMREAASCRAIAFFLMDMGDLQAAKQWNETAMSLERQTGGVGADCTGQAGLIAMEEGEYEKAERFLEESLASAREEGDLRTEGTMLRGLGDLAFRRQQYRLALDLLSEAVRRLQEAGDRIALVGLLIEWAGLAAYAGVHTVALTLVSGVEAQHERMGARVSPTASVRLVAIQEGARKVLAPEAVEQALAEGRTLPLEALIAMTAGEWTRAIIERPIVTPEAAITVTVPTGTELLTAREQEVIKLLAEGLTAREIGERLYLSPRTVEKHEENIRAKLAVPNRAALVAWAAQRGLA